MAHCESFTPLNTANLMDSLLAFHSNNFPSEVSAAVILFLLETMTL